jgi:hypothetical protein
MIILIYLCLLPVGMVYLIWDIIRGGVLGVSFVVIMSGLLIAAALDPVNRPHVQHYIERQLSYATH